ncbi:MAG: pyridoxal 5'-phosphate synthase glutaminase subunit PdxT [Francisellaceae bacterium]
MRMGVLAIQGGFHAHLSMFGELDCEVVEIRQTDELNDLDALVLPGGESTVMARLLHKHNMWQAVADFAAHRPVMATCAGVILLQQMGVLNIEVVRNAYGRQLESRIQPLSLPWTDEKIEVMFIRAPLIKAIHDPAISTLVSLNGYPVAIVKDQILAMTFHPELSQDKRLHQYFIDEIVKHETRRQK